MWAMVAALAASLSSEAEATACSQAARTASSFWTVSGQLVASNLLKVSVLSAGGGGGFLSFELGGGFGVPEEGVVGEDADGMIGGGGVGGGGGGDPAGVLGGEAGDGGVDGDEPLGLVVGGAELGEEDGTEGGGFGFG